MNEEPNKQLRTNAMADSKILYINKISLGQRFEYNFDGNSVVFEAYQ